MTNDKKIKRIGEFLNRLCLDDLTKDELFTKLDEMSINEIKDHMWELYCFVDDVCDTVNFL